MKLILVATDGSESAGRAIDFASELANNLGADVIIFYAQDDAGLPSDIMSRLNSAEHSWLKEQLDAIGAEILKKARERARSAGARTVILEMRVGDAALTVLDVVQEKGADLVVVGRRGRGRLAGLLMGSVSQKLVSVSPRPVIVVP